MKRHFRKLQILWENGRLKMAEIPKNPINSATQLHRTTVASATARNCASSRPRTGVPRLVNYDCSSDAKVFFLRTGQAGIDGVCVLFQRLRMTHDINIDRVKNNVNARQVRGKPLQQNHDVTISAESINLSPMCPV